MANVRKKPDGEYVYSIQLNENKKTPASPVAVFAKSNPALSVGEPGSDSVAENGLPVKRQYSIDDGAEQRVEVNCTLAFPIAELLQSI